MSLSSIYMDARPDDLSASSDDGSSSSGRTSRSRVGILRRLNRENSVVVRIKHIQQEQIYPWEQCRPGRDAKGLLVAATLS